MIQDYELECDDLCEELGVPCSQGYQCYIMSLKFFLASMFCIAPNCIYNFINNTFINLIPIHENHRGASMPHYNDYKNKLFQRAKHYPSYILSCVEDDIPYLIQ